MTTAKSPTPHSKQPSPHSPPQPSASSTEHCTATATSSLNSQHRLNLEQANSPEETRMKEQRIRDAMWLTTLKEGSNKPSLSRLESLVHFTLKDLEEIYASHNLRTPAKSASRARTSLFRVLIQWSAMEQLQKYLNLWNEGVISKELPIPFCPTLTAYKPLA